MVKVQKYIIRWPSKDERFPVVVGLKYTPPRPANSFQGQLVVASPIRHGNYAEKVLGVFDRQADLKARKKTTSGRVRFTMRLSVDKWFSGFQNGLNPAIQAWSENIKGTVSIQPVVKLNRLMS